MQWGTDDQKKRYLQPILAGDEIWCEGMSEPGAGSDLAALQTRAELKGDDFVVNGQKVWTTIAHRSDYCQLFVRTRSRGAQAQGYERPAGRHEGAGRHSTAAQADHRRFRIQRNLLRRRTRAEGKSARPDQPGMAGAGFDADARAVRNRRDAGRHRASARAARRSRQKRRAQWTPRDRGRRYSPAARAIRD